MIVVSDTSIVSGLFLIGRLPLLETMYGKIVLPKSVFSELSRLQEFHYDLSEIRNSPWIEVKTLENSTLFDELKTSLDIGEAEAIALAKELSAELLLIDELKGRKIATEVGIQVIGLVGILLQAKQETHIPLVRPLLEDLKAKAGFWLSEHLYQKVLAKAGEANP